MPTEEHAINDSGRSGKPRGGGGEDAFPSRLVTTAGMGGGAGNRRRAGMRSIIGASRNGNAKTGTVAGTTGRGTLGGTLAACGWDRTDGREYASQEGANSQQFPRDDYPYRSYPYMYVCRLALLG